VKPINRKSRKKTAFTLVELLTVMSIIIILMSLLIPGLNSTRRFARKVKQKAQFHSIDVALELFKGEHDEYPSSDAFDATTNASYDYCGAMKLCEAMVGQDLMGFHPDSRFREDFSIDGNPAPPPAGTLLYDRNPRISTDDPDEQNLKSRQKNLPPENANAFRLWVIYNTTRANPTDPSPGPHASTLPFNQCSFVLCDVYTRVRNVQTGARIGMPILYYKANTAGTTNPNVNNTVTIDDDTNYFNYRDNDQLVQLVKPWDGGEHIMASNYSGTPPPPVGPRINFYDRINNNQIGLQRGMPFRPDSYILLSAGFDGEYGTTDDIYNFEQ
jgi:type II secretory pathway pseudopilin PulG